MHDLDMYALAAMYGGAHGAWGRTMVALTLLGSGWSAFALLPLMGWTRTRPFASILALAILAQAIFVWSIKLAVGRVRPWIAMGLPAPWGAPHDGSFPSGHAAGSFCVAAFLVVVLPAAWPPAWRGWLVAAVTVAFATLVAVSRVYLGAHFPSDVVAGGVLGALVGGSAGGLYLAREQERIRLGPGPADV
jgi:membrane-associated phospholipid phosphatase